MRIPFDTHAFVKELIAAGVPENQAEVHARLMSEMVIERLATKDDLKLLKDDLKLLEERLGARINTLATKDELKDLELRLTLRFGAMLAAAVAVTVTLVKIL